MADKKRPSKKKVDVVKASEDKGTQVHFGNAELLKLKLLESISKNTAEIARLMRDVKEGK